MNFSHCIPTVRPRKSGDPGLHIEAEPMALGPRFRGDERWNAHRFEQEMGDA
jgi:hypothetical protein